jgi:hypothetical protein
VWIDLRLQRREPCAGQLFGHARDLDLALASLDEVPDGVGDSGD